MLRQMLWASAGLVAGILIANHRLESYYEDRLHKEVEDAQDHFRRIYEKKLDLKMAERDAMEKDLREMATTAADVLEVYQGVSVKPSVVQQEEARVVHENSMRPEEPPTNPSKMSDMTHVITENEFNATPEDYTSFSFTYCIGDDTLLGQKDQVLDKETRGEILNDSIFEILKQNDEALNGTLYARNDVAKWDFDIAIATETAREILGLDDDDDEYQIPTGPPIPDGDV